MKLSISLLYIATATFTANAFTMINNRPTKFSTNIGTRQVLEVAASENSDVTEMVAESAVPEADAYARIGITTDELALGIDATEFLQWIGTRSELVERFMNDNKGMTEERANMEVSKFLMDAEMVNAYIRYEKNKAENPSNLKAEAEQALSDPKTIATYAAWLIAGSSFGWFRKSVIEPKYESGEWEEIRISLPFWPKPDEAAQAVSSISSAIDSIDTNIAHDVVQSAV